MHTYNFLVAVVRDLPGATSLSWWIFLAGGSVMFFIALMILCNQAVKTANDNAREPLSATEGGSVSGEL